MINTNLFATFIKHVRTFNISMYTVQSEMRNRKLYFVSNKYLVVANTSLHFLLTTLGKRNTLQYIRFDFSFLVYGTCSYKTLGFL